MPVWYESGLKFSVMMIIICTPLLVLQLTSLPIFLIYRNYRQNVCFRILFTNGIADSLQLGAMLIYAIINLTADDISEFTLKIGGAIVMPAWNLLVLQHFLLALNRLIMILRARYLGSKFIPDEGREACAFNIAHFLVWALFLAVVGLFMTPYVGTAFYRATSQFTFDLHLPYTQTFRDVTYYLTIVLPVICFGIYITIVLLAQMSRRSVHQRGTNNGPLLNEQERRLLIQAIILYAFMSFLIISWNAFTSCDNQGYCSGKILGIVPVRLSNDWHTVSIEVPWMIFCGLNPVLFLTMNREFRKRYLQIYTRKPAGQVSQMLTSITHLDCLEGNNEDRYDTSRERKAVSHDPAGMDEENFIQLKNVRRVKSDKAIF